MALYLTFRKGGVTYVLSFPGGPNVVAAFLRARWSLGSVQQRYIFEGEGSDQLCGRTATGLPLNSIDFAILPPHFDPEFVFDDSTWQLLHPCYDRFPKRFQTCMPYLLASLVYHYDWLNGNLHISHPLRMTYLWTSGCIRTFQSHIILGHTQCAKSPMMASGIPPALSVMHKMMEMVDGLKAVNQALRESKEAIEQELENLRIQLPHGLSEHLMRNFSINGALPITLQQVELMFGDLRSQIVHHINELATSRSEAPGVSLPISTNDADEAMNEIPRFPKYLWPSDGKFHNVPESFTLVSTNASVLWELWHYGNITDNIAPYRLIQKCDLRTASQQTRLVSARNVMNTIFGLADEVGAVPTNVKNGNLLAPNRPRSLGRSIFQAGFSRLISALKSSTLQKSSERKFEELQFTTLHIDIKKAGIDKIWKQSGN